MNAALSGADEAIAAGDPASAERWLKVARQATAMEQDVAGARQRQAEADPAARLAAYRARREAILAVIGRRLDRLAALPDDEPVERLPLKPRPADPM
ncbi:MAG: hypothetical protein MUF14_04830 [Hyphomonadaceae bacterium]|nr:hypothetical protein [Hyphomonadaceae bacterium]